MGGKLWQRGKTEDGAVAVIVAILITVFIGLSAYVADIGYMYEMRRQLQSAADAAALAGMAEKIRGGTDAHVLAVAREIADKNDLVGLPEKLTVLETPPDTEITDSYIKVTVSKRADLFFTPIFGMQNRLIRAQAKAKRVYVTGAKGLIPWGVSIIRASRVSATVGGITTELTYDAGTDSWQGSLPVPAAASADGYPVDLTILNGQGFPETFSGVGSIVVHRAGDAVSNVYLDGNVLSPGDSSELYVEASGTPKAQVGGDRYSEVAFSLAGANLYKTSIGAPASTQPFETFPIDVSVGSSSFKNAARLIVRQSNSPIDRIDFGTLHFAAGGGSASIEVKMRVFQYGEVYNLKVVADPETGNFNALDFRYVYHPTDYTWNHGMNDSAADYYDNLAGAYPGEIHIGDIITTKTGNLSGPMTTSSLDTRIAGCTLTFAQWEAAGKPATCGRLIYVPIVERIERITGQSDVVVVAIAVFFLESYEKIGGEKVNITGRFVEYARTGTYSDTPPEGGLYMETVRLDKPDY